MYNYNSINNIYKEFYKNKKKYYNDCYFLNFINNKSIDYFKLYFTEINNAYFRYIKLILLYHDKDFKNIRCNDLRLFFNEYFKLDFSNNNFYNEYINIILNIDFVKIAIKNKNIVMYDYRMS